MSDPLRSRYLSGRYAPVLRDWGSSDEDSGRGKKELAMDWQHWLRAGRPAGAMLAQIIH